MTDIISHSEIEKLAADLASKIRITPLRCSLEQQHFTEPKPIVCKWCGSKDIIKHGIREGVQEYICLKCKRKFNAKDAPYGMQTTVEQIGASLAMYYDGLSLADIARQLDITYQNPVDRSTIYRWLTKFTGEAIRLLEPLKPKVSNTWVADETAIKFNSQLFWVWDIIDYQTRFLLATYLSPHRGTNEARTLMERAAKRANKAPKRVVTDKLRAYLDGIELTFGSDTQHIQSSPFDVDSDNNIIERMQGTIKDRTKVIRGFKTVPTAELILDGFLIHYNFFRPHMSLNGKTPAQEAKLVPPVTNWTELVRKVGLRQ